MTTRTTIIMQVGSYDIEASEQVKFVKENSWTDIILFRNPCKEAQLEAVKRSKFAIKTMRDPCMEAKILHRNIYEIEAPLNFTCHVCNEGKMNLLNISKHPGCENLIHRKCFQNLGKAFSCASCDQNKITPKDFVCPICLEEENKFFLKTLACKHIFHEKCITQWFKGYNTCPCCRSC